MMKVKNNLKNILSIFFLSIALFLNAQQNKFIGGLLLNINGICITGNSGQFWNLSNGKVSGGHVGISAGIFVKREFTRKIYSTLEFRYIAKGSIYVFTSQYGTQAFETLYLRYVELPVLFGYKIKLNKRVYYFESGLAFAKLISSKIEADYSLNINGIPNTNEFKSTDISWIGSLKFPLIRKWEKNFLFGLRVSHSILPIHKYYKIYNFDYGIEFNYRFN